MASISTSLRGVRPDVALLLALAAYRLNPRPATRGTLISALRSAQMPGGIRILHGHSRRVTAVAVSADGRWIVTGGDDRTIRLWDARGGGQVGPPRRASTSVVAVAMSRDGRTIVAADGKRILLWRRGVHRPPRLLAGHTDEVWALALTPDGRVLASTGYDDTVRFWDARTGAPIGRPVVTPSLNGLNALTFSPDGRLLAGGGDGEAGVQIWNTRTHRQVGSRIRADPDWINSLAFTSDGQVLLSLGASGEVRFWSVRTRREIGRPIHALTETSGTTIAIGGERDRVLAVAGSADGRIRLWDLRTRRPLARVLHAGSGPVLGLASSDASTLVSAGADGTARIWDLRTASPVGAPLPLGGVVDISGLAFAPDGKTLAVAATPKIFTFGADDPIPDDTVRTSRAAVTLWDVRRRTEVAALPSTRLAAGVAFAARSGLLAYVTDQIRFWDLRRHRPVGTPIAATSSVALSPDGRTVASVRPGNSALLWSTRTGAPGPMLAGDSRFDEDYMPHHFAFSPDGGTVAYTTDRGTVEFWDVVRRRQVSRPLRGHEDVVLAVAYSRDGQRIATAGADRTVRLWDARTHREIGAPWQGNGSTVSSVAFSPDGRTLASGGWDGTVRLWDVASGQQLSSPLTAHHARVSAVAFGDDDTFASAGEDGTVRIWRGLTWRDEQDVTREVCRIVGRDLSAGELATYAAGLPVGRAC